MRYVIVDTEGATRARFGRLQEVRDWACALAARDEELLDELILLTYDAAGNEVANQWLSDFVPEPQTASVGTSVQLRETQSVVSEAVMGFAGAGPLAGSFGTATSIHPASRRRQTTATDTVRSGAGERVAG